MATQIGGSGCQSKHKAHRSRVKESYYKQQFHVTERNKNRRKLARARRKTRWSTAANN